MDAPYFSIGLTGGIGCGKSTVADMFATRGASIVDTDQIAHSLTAPDGAAMPALVAQFGAEYADANGALDRAKMRALVFSDANAKARLEAILHPRIRQATLTAAAEAKGDYVIFAVPLLVESGGWVERVNRVLVIDCLESLQVSRVMARNGLSEEQVKAIMATQATRAMRLAAADDVIDNNGDLAALEPQIAQLHDVYLAFSKRITGMGSQRL
ncbi:MULTISPECIES: dephospho-CoA kinase [unclassified Janthinobacterium]|uniref:dephospho-CoA kinase n=1 Tax=unclassified Janthinobacterium TaxID=2610881 RepID=UPI001622A7E1|nr:MULTISPECIES: dephospho-CoA kinase [unclassified Janthinobacterium]MBB5370602.1 dephospho-CoA kinase [Janthinobacterium sp. K2C7]MBB5383184.1 dephospho-CoA kinase [Janthinobacterium sp. K2Li3]MBB5388638.1 dephospho-CoA kinase [Janthinobacterium sp. K2E3]